MADARPRPGPEALKAFVHPLRIAMFEYLVDHGPATATQLAEATGESTGQTSYHLRQLAKHGFVEDDPEHSGGRERWWRPVGFTVEADDFADDAVRGALVGMVTARDALRGEQVRRWLERMPAEAPEWRGVAMSIDGRAMMTAEELDAMTTELGEVLDRHFDAAKAIRKASGDAGRRAVRVHIDAFPVADVEGATPEVDPADGDGGRG
ncbi:MAG: helix-turn-helix domain-containing protein [Actinomycetales bacterium]|nr:helix-turn-helix domain-containing protein [Actinomycetales bacterium]